MANCADCGQNPKRGCLPTCPRDKTRSVWARYRARKKARAEKQAIDDACVDAVHQLATIGGRATP